MENTKINIDVEKQNATIDLKISLDDLICLQIAVQSKERTIKNPKRYVKFKRLLDELNLTRLLVNELLNN